MPIYEVNPPSTLFTPGRTCPLTAVVLHEYKGDITTLDQEMQQCLRPRPLCSPSCHKSFHYGIGTNCTAHQYIDPADTAWGFWFEPTPACPVPPCPIIQECDGLGADQYNPHPDGTPATPDVTADPNCQEANCSVIHVAVATGSRRVSSGLYCVDDPNFNPNAYACLVQTLCEIYETIGLTPDGYTNLLTHIGELVDLDLDQLAIDIQECLDFVPPPLPPCECTPAAPTLTSTDTATFDPVVAGLNISGNVRISTTVGNQVVADADGLFVAETPLVANDSNTIDFTQSGAAGHTFTGTVKIASVEGNFLEEVPGGLQVLIPPASPPLVDCNGVLLTEANNVVTEQNIVAGFATPILSADAIIAYYTGDPCPGVLRADPCGLDLPLVPVVLGAPIGGGVPVWGRAARQALRVSTFTQLTPEISPATADVFVYTGDNAFAVELAEPIGECLTNDVWIKNRSAFDLTISPASGTIDGAASITLLGTSVGTYPWNTDGGETVHLVWTGSEWIIV